MSSLAVTMIFRTSLIVLCPVRKPWWGEFDDYLAPPSFVVSLPYLYPGILMPGLLFSILGALSISQGLHSRRVDAVGGEPSAGLPQASGIEPS